MGYIFIESQKYHCCQSCYYFTCVVLFDKLMTKH